MHRVGRTGRAGEKGVAISLVTENELAQLKKIGDLYNIELKLRYIYEGKIMEHKKTPYRGKKKCNFNKKHK